MWKIYYKILFDDAYNFKFNTNTKMLEFLTGKKNHFIGIDFGTSSIKVVELSYEDQKVKLENYGIVDLDLGNQEVQSRGANITSYEQRLNDALKGLIEKMDMRKGLQAYVSIPGFSGLITIIDLPEMKQDELAKAIQFEAHKYIPSSLDEVSMSWEIIEHIDPGKALSQNLGKDAGKRIKVLLVAAPKKDIEHYDRLVSGANFEVSAIELETFSIARSLVGDEVGNFFIIDIGSRATNMILYENGIVKVNRNIDAGGNEITSAIIDGMNIARQRAEIFKKSEKDLINGKESVLVIPVLELIIGESKRILNAYREKNQDVKIEKVFVSGGTSKMKGIEEYFSHSLSLPVVKGDPWKNIIVDEKVKTFTEGLGASFSVALGLALRGVEEYKRE
jgi:type IV pilus assembly protein PilM